MRTAALQRRRQYERSTDQPVHAHRMVHRGINCGSNISQSAGDCDHRRAVIAHLGTFPEYRASLTKPPQAARQLPPIRSSRHKHHL